MAVVSGCSDGRDLVPISSMGRGGGTGGGDPVACPYPDNVAWGNEVGQTIKSRSFVGFPEGYNESEVIDVENYHDCDGSRGVRALVLDTSAVWCEACGVAAKAFSSVQYEWVNKGIHVLTLLMQDGVNEPATIQTAAAWKMKYNLMVGVGVDPDRTYVVPLSGDGSSLPVVLLVDPRSMRVVSRWEGFKEIDPAIEELAQKNSGK